MNQNVYPAQSEDVLAALPIRATRVNMNGNHTTFFNTEADDVAVGPSAIRSRRHTCDYTSMQHRSDG